MEELTDWDCRVGLELWEGVGRLLRSRGVSVATAESCTAGGIASSLAAVPGSSDYLIGGIVCYRMQAKERLLGCSAEMLHTHGVVSPQTVIEMARGAARLFEADAAVATSGIAGPSGAEPGKPVGTIWMAAVCGSTCLSWMQSADSGRAENVRRAVDNALRLLERAVIDEKG